MIGPQCSGARTKADPGRNRGARRRLFAAALGVVAVCSGLAAATTLESFPARVELGAGRTHQRIVLRASLDDGAVVDVTLAASVESADSAVVGVSRMEGEDRPALVAHAAGETVVRAEWEGARIEIPVVVAEGQQGRVRFTHDVIARMTRAGCNSGACHGSQHGRGGFKLSLLGYEPDLDFAALREGSGRRIDRLDIDRSLLIAKPLGTIAHEGGQRFSRDSALHRALRGWIAEGGPAPATNETTVESIEIAPSSWVMSVGGDAHIIVTARLSDGRVEDVTGRALMESLQSGIVEIDPQGRLSAKSPGQTSIMVRYEGQPAVVRATVPFRRIDAIDGFTPRSVVDGFVIEKWLALGLRPSGVASDGEFIRRVYLATIGVLPTPEDVARFLDDGSPDKRDRLVDAVLDRPEYVDYQTLEWGDLLRVHRSKMNEKGMWSLHNWLRAQMRDNRPLDRMVRDLITAQGSTYTSGPTNYFRVVQRPNELAETTAQVFLGLRLQCAQCHHHPFEKWTQEDYWSLAAYFARLGVKSSSEFGVYGREQVVYVKSGGEVRHPRTGAVLPPKPLDAPVEDDAIDRRRALARWLTSDDNRLFARYFANRIWAQLFGRGLVEPIDDMRVTNPPSHPELLEALADELVRAKFDQKALMRTILRSSTFAIASATTEENRLDDVFYSHFPVRRLPAELLHDAICSATGVPAKFTGVPAGSRAVELPDPEFKSYFLESFGKPKREIACECDRASQPNMAQALHLVNGDFVHDRVVDAEGRVGRALAKERTTESIVEELYLATFSRRPTPEEQVAALAFVESAGRKEGLEDLLWALCNAPEFLFRH